MGHVDTAPEALNAESVLVGTMIFEEYVNLSGHEPSDSQEVIIV